MRVTGVLLAGGEAKRLGGGDKCLKMLGDTTLLSQTIERVEGQVDTLVLNANGDPSRFANFALSVVGDESGAYGPLAGILAGMEWSLKNAPTAEFVASFATDTPYLPLDLVSRLHAALAASDVDIAYATSGGNAHPVFSLWKVSLSASLRDALINRKERKVRAYIAGQKSVAVDWPVIPADPFLNINTPDDLDQAKARVEQTKKKGGTD